MKKRLIILLAVMVLLSVALVPASADSGQRGRRVDGIWCYMPGGIAEVDLGPDYTPPGEIFLAATYDSTWTGTFKGTSNDTGLLISHMPEDVPWPGIPMSFVGTSWIKGAKVGRRSGDLQMDVIGDRPDATAEWKGRFVVTGGTGDLENYKASGTWWGPGWLGDPTACGVIYYRLDRPLYRPHAGD